MRELNDYVCSYVAVTPRPLLLPSISHPAAGEKASRKLCAANWRGGQKNKKARQLPAGEMAAAQRLFLGIQTDSPSAMGNNINNLHAGRKKTGRTAAHVCLHGTPCNN